MQRWQSWVVAMGLSLAAPVLSSQEYSASVNYQLRCAGCHGQDGMGVPAGGIPPFPKYVDGFFSTENSRLYLMHVPGINGASLTDREIAAVMNYVGERWGEPGARKPFTAEEVTALRARPVEDVVALRRDVTEELNLAGYEVPDYPWP